MRYEIDLKNDEDDDYYELADNVGTVEVLDQEEESPHKHPRVMISLSRNAMIGLGTELIRMAHRFEIGRHMHIEPMEEGLVCQSMGVFLTPESSELIIMCGDEKDVDSYIAPELQDDGS
ncbi:MULTISPECIES: hypothetical protein [Exiguobacterium]|uniref:hypothetical protein n=1 Tax=Exiguobacterium TaxID=33986 RepID=UPI001BE693D2|nr:MULTISPECIES: hypothetical protein [Exiguobacterium]MCT4782081.1 hypothetical protein [Exiguobacterium himgiriensis]